jgi:hypothetical protein
MIDPSQVKLKYVIESPLTSEQLAALHRFLAPKPEGKGFLPNFILNNRSHTAYWKLDDEGREQEMTSDPKLFDLWKCVALCLAAICGYDYSGIFSEQPDADHGLFDPSDAEIRNALLSEIARQVIAVVRTLDGDIPIVSNNAVLMGQLPYIDMRTAS